MNRDSVIARVLPQFFPAHWLDAPGIVFTDSPSRIRIGYVLRGDGEYSYVMEDHVSKLGVGIDELHSAALDNLARLPSGQVTIGKMPGGAEGWLSATEDNFAAVRILLPAAQQIFQEALGERFLLTIPHRDYCFCWSLTQSSELQESHAREALEDFLEDDYNLTPDVLICAEASFSLYREQPTKQAAIRPPLERPTPGARPQ